MFLSKLLLTLLNLIFWVVGGSMLGVGIWLLVDEYTFNYLLIIEDSWYWEVLLYMTVSAGAAMVLVGFLGCCGVCRNGKVLSILYGVFVTVAIIAEITAITFVAIVYSNLGGLEEDMTHDVKYRYINETDSDPLSRAWNSMQIQWECCGSTDYMSYTGSNFRKNSQPDVNVPWTCCKLNDLIPFEKPTIDDVINYEQCQIEAMLNPEYFDYLNNKGGYHEAEDVMDLVAPLTLALLSIFIIVQIFGVRMFWTMKKKNKGEKTTKMVDQIVT